MSLWAQGFSGWRLDAPSPQLEDDLLELLAATVDLRLGAHMIHLNIQGSNAYQNHLLTERIYEALDGAVDEVGEHIRSMEIEVPGSTKDLLTLSFLPPLDDAADPDSALPALAAASELMRDRWNTVANEAGEDQLTIDLAASQARLHAKNAYLLNSVIKGA